MFILVIQAKCELRRSLVFQVGAYTSENLNLETKLIPFLQRFLSWTPSPSFTAVGIISLRFDGFEVPYYAVTRKRGAPPLLRVPHLKKILFFADFKNGSKFSPKLCGGKGLAWGCSYVVKRVCSYLLRIFRKIDFYFIF